MNVSSAIYLVLLPIGFAVIIWLVIKLTKANVHLQLTLGENEELKQRNSVLSSTYTEHVKELQQCHDKITHLSTITQEAQMFKEQTLEASKLALLELTRDLHNQFTAQHQQESFEYRKVAEHSVHTAVEKFNTQFEKILGMVASLDNRVANTDSLLESIKNNLLNPINAGQLAEITLENVLRSSGLKEDIDFVLQHHLIGQDYSKLRPDAVIFLPGNRLMIVDAKASRVFLEQDDSQENLEYLRKSIASHLKSLSSKEYHKALAEYYPLKAQACQYIITLMFLPTETALEQAMRADKDFIAKAWEESILVVGPVGLRNMLNLSKFHIADYDRQKNYETIFHEITNLVHAVSTLMEHAAKIGGNIQSLVSNYDKFTASFNRSLFNRLNNLESLGINLEKKPLPLTRYQLTSFNKLSEEIAE